ncbi:MAG: metallophosphoesterase [Syntrophomonas sp.]
MGFWSIATFLVAGIAVYVTWRGRQAFVPPRYKWAYWLGCSLLLASFILLRILKPGSGAVGHVLTWLGSYSLAAFFYAFIVVLLLDIVRKADDFLGFIPSSFRQSPSRVGLGAIAVLVCILFYGSWNAWHPVIQPYELNIAKKVSGDKDLHVVMVSDLHLGTIVNRERLSNMVGLINQRNPDMVVLAGDVVDGDMEPFKEQQMDDVLAQLKPKLGTFMVLGNHDGRSGEEITHLLADGITVLRDQYQLVDGRFYVIGRDNRGFQPSSKAKIALTQVMAGINQEKPIILIDHNPSNLDEALTSGVDLQLSGHTHQGQMFPNNFITANMYEVDWGYLKKERLQVVVSTGIGTWGPPIRVGNTPELVDMLIHFQ